MVKFCHAGCGTPVGEYDVWCSAQCFGADDCPEDNDDHFLERSEEAA